jgi:hypothetical protein
VGFVSDLYDKTRCSSELLVCDERALLATLLAGRVTFLRGSFALDFESGRPPDVRLAGRTLAAECGLPLARFALSVTIPAFLPLFLELLVLDLSDLLIAVVERSGPFLLEDFFLDVMNHSA